MASVIPSYLRSQVLEGGGSETLPELALSQVEAIEAQTAVLERIAAALERLAEQSAASGAWE